MSNVPAHATLSQSLPALAGPLPAFPGRPLVPQLFVGRQAELAQVVAQLRGLGVAAISGPAGSGKTALAAAAAETLATPAIWIELLPGLVDTAEAFSWQLMAPLAAAEPATWQQVVEAKPGGRPLPLLVRLQLTLEALGREGRAPLICIDRAELAGEPALAAVVTGLCDFVAHSRRAAFAVLVVGRILPWRIGPYALPPLGGLSLDALADWANALGLRARAADLRTLHQATGGLPGAITPVLGALEAGATHVPGQPLRHPAVRRMVGGLLAELPVRQREVVEAVAAQGPRYRLAPDQALAASALEEQGLVTVVGPQVALHPLLGQFYNRGA